MIQYLRTSRFSKVVASYLAIQLIVMTIQPSNVFALTGGPAQPEFNSFTPIGTSDMVNLASGDFNYNIPIMDVGGYPLNLAYDSGITMDQEASWVGLGWNLNVGQINRQVRGIPDDFNGDEMRYENKLKTNRTVGFTARLNPQVFGTLDNPGDVLGGGLSFGLTMQYNNYEGISFKPSYGFSFDVAGIVQTGMNLTTSATEGVSITPNVGIGWRMNNTKNNSINGLSGGLNLGVNINSRQGLTALNVGASLRKSYEGGVTKYGKHDRMARGNAGVGGSGSISFLNNTFTPTKRNTFQNNNTTFSGSFGADVWGADGEIGVDLFGSNQSLTDDDRNSVEKAYGYDYTHFATTDDILDFNREKDNTVTKNTLILPVTNYTYDIYAINGQGIGGQFRPFSGQIGYMYDRFRQDEGFGIGGGGSAAEVEGGAGFHVGVDLKLSPSENHNGVWNTNATSFFHPSNPENDHRDYEPVYFKSIGEFRVDDESSFFNETLGGKSPVALEIGGLPSAPGKYARNTFRKKVYNENTGVPSYETMPAFSGKLKREHRERRNQAITKFTAQEAALLSTSYEGVRNGALITPNPNAEGHHTAGMHIMQPDGSRYIYGETTYNKTKEEVTFAVEGTANCTTGLVSYSSSTNGNGGQTGDNSNNNERGLDHFFNRISTPDYAHTYLLSSVLSADYEDIIGDGPTDDDLGAYTRFHYSTPVTDYQWRIPYKRNHASYNEGLKTHTSDEKGNYVYGVKELKYIDRIETKTHVAVFDISLRNDGFGVNDENGGGNAATSSRMYKLDKISLYAKPEYQLLQEGDPTISPIKVAHFEYDYALCSDVPNNHINTDGTGKLTLNKMYFTYRDSQMGKYTPYAFNYDGPNPAYNLKGYDVWGNYKPNDQGSCSAQGPTTAAEFPFVQQEDRALQDQYASAWSLTSIDLPSGGKLELEYETDDYQYVQNRRAMQMFKVVGVSSEEEGAPQSLDEVNNALFNPDNFGEDAKYLVVNISEDLDAQQFEEQYVGEHLNKPIYFRFMTQMVRNQEESYDFVTGYFEIDQSAGFHVFTDSNSHYGVIPMKFLRMEGGSNGNNMVNPISKASWYFGRQNLNRQVYGLDVNPDSFNLGDMANALGSSVQAITEIFQGPNEALRKEWCGRLFNPEKSWIRLQHSGDEKLGGGLRVKRIALHDKWDTMVGISASNPNYKRYTQFYGQEYNYNLENGHSSGVATYEPNLSRENPLVEPFYNQSESDYLVAPKEINYVEKPFGESFFPTPTVTYRRVEVKNLEREDIENDAPIIVRKNATGKVINEFYTSYDFPTETDYTTINTGGYYSNENNAIESIISGILGLQVATETELTLSQGFVVRTNDMNGRERKQSVFNENGAFISGVDYIYSMDEQGKLDNTLPVIYPDGAVSEQEIGTHYDMITDFRENYSSSETFGIQTNVVVIPCVIPIIVPTIIPERAKHENTLHMATTTKVVHTTGIMKEKIAYDLGAKVSTENVAWDSESGQVLLTRTINEYDDHYYNTTYPAHWFGRIMDKATNNLGMTGRLLHTQGEPFDADRANFILEEHNNDDNAEATFQLGDELLTYGVDPNSGIPNIDVERLWVVSRNGSTVQLMNREGKIVNQPCSSVEKLYDLNFKIIRSGYRNQHSASMASVTSQVNPIDINNDNTLNNLDEHTFSSSSGLDYKIINASAVRYGQLWEPQEELGLPRIPTSIIQGYANAVLDDNSLGNVPWENFGFNPYVYNALGEVRAVNSYAYLSGRDNSTTGSSEGVAPRRQGFFTDFEPFYMITGDNYSVNPSDKWTFASEVTQYSPYGAELENKDALDRFSAAQYGYNYTLPTAVASNSKYAEIGFDGFEDYRYAGNGENENAHFAIASDIDQVTDETAHTGRYSIKIEGGGETTLFSNLNTTNYEVTQPADCSDTEPCYNYGDPLGINELECNNTVTYSLPGSGIFSDETVTSSCGDVTVEIIGVNQLQITFAPGSWNGCISGGNPDEVIGTLIVNYTINGEPCDFIINLINGDNC